MWVSNCVCRGHNPQVRTAKIRADTGEDGTQHLFIAAKTVMGLAGHVPTDGAGSGVRDPADSV